MAVCSVVCFFCGVAVYGLLWLFIVWCGVMVVWRFGGFSGAVALWCDVLCGGCENQ